MKDVEFEYPDPIFNRIKAYFLLHRKENPIFMDKYKHELKTKWMFQKFRFKLQSFGRNFYKCKQNIKRFLKSISRPATLLLLLKLKEQKKNLYFLFCS